MPKKIDFTNENPTRHSMMTGSPPQDKIFTILRRQNPSTLEA